MIKLKDLLLESKKPKFKLKSGIDLELSLLLQKKFIDQISSVVGRDFEDLIVKYFSGGFAQTNVGTVESAFSDVKQGNTYYSVKYSKAVKSQTLSKVERDTIQIKYKYNTVGRLCNKNRIFCKYKINNNFKTFLREQASRLTFEVDNQVYILVSVW